MYTYMLTMITKRLPILPLLWCTVYIRMYICTHIQICTCTCKRYRERLLLWLNADYQNLGIWIACANGPCFRVCFLQDPQGELRAAGFKIREMIPTALEGAAHGGLRTRGTEVCRYGPYKVCSVNEWWHWIHVTMSIKLIMRNPIITAPHLFKVYHM